MRLALVGLGYWGGKVLRSMVSMLGPGNVVAVDRSESLLDWARVSYPGLVCRDSLDAALEHPDLDGVVIATSVASHAPLTAMACDRGVPCSSRSHLAAARARLVIWPRSPMSSGSR